MPDEIFANPRLAALYDEFDSDRSDLGPYVAMVDEFGARSVVDIGCGTGTFACLLAARGVEVTGVEPAAASLDVARGKPGANEVRWILGDATALPALEADLATMTANVAQVFVGDDDWLDTLAAVRRSLRPGGRFVFESRDPARRAWVDWTRDQSWRRLTIAGVGDVETWVELLDVSLPLVTFRHSYHFVAESAVLTSDSTLRFRGRDELTETVNHAGFAVVDVRDAPDRPGKEFVIIARTADGSERF